MGVCLMETPPQGFDGHGSGAVKQELNDSFIIKLYQKVRSMSPGAAYRVLCDESIAASDEEVKQTATFLKRRVLWEAGK